MMVVKEYDIATGHVETIAGPMDDDKAAAFVAASRTSGYHTVYAVPFVAPPRAVAVRVIHEGH